MKNLLQDNLAQSVAELQQALQYAIALSVIAAGSDFDNHDRELIQSYLNMLLEYLHKTDTLFNKLKELLDL